MNEVEKTTKVDNERYRERFQFQLLVNDDIICQRYFKILKFNPISLRSEELYDTLDNIVHLIQKELESKSRVYLSRVMDNKVKLTGFASKAKALKEAKERGASQAEITNIILRHEADETYVECPAKEWHDNEFVNPGDVTFRFTFMVDDRSVYERIWDGSQYPKYVRNSVDLANSKSDYPMLRVLNCGREDIAVKAINLIHDVCSNNGDENKQYTRSTMYGDKKYSYSSYDREYVNGWRMWCLKKYGPQTF